VLKLGVKFRSLSLAASFCPNRGYRVEDILDRVSFDDEERLVQGAILLDQFSLGVLDYDKGELKGEDAFEVRVHNAADFREVFSGFGVSAEVSNADEPVFQAECEADFSGAGDIRDDTDLLDIAIGRWLCQSDSEDKVDDEEKWCKPIAAIAKLTGSAH